MWDLLNAFVWICRLLAVAIVCFLVFSPGFGWGAPEVVVPLLLLGAVVWIVAEVVRYRNRDVYRS